MRRNFCVFLLLTLFTFAVWNKALLNFFAQDDFILVEQFSQNNLWQDIKNVFGPPQVTHWRPIHNLFFLITGNIFSKNYFEYHLVTLVFHIGASFLIYKITQKLTGNVRTAIISGFFYGVHPAHFVSLFWISGGATLIGFFFLAASFYNYILEKKILSLILYVLALLTSEAMIVGLAILVCFEVLVKGKKIDKLFLTLIGSISAIFLITRFVFLTSKTTFDAYQIEFSIKTISAVKYYLLRIAGFAEVSGDLTISLILLSWLALIVLLLTKTLNKRKIIHQLIFSIAIIVIGLFPFILIPQHLSPHYMNVSIFGFAIVIGLALKQLGPIISFIFLAIFVGIAIYNIDLTKDNNWVITRSNLAKTYLAKIERDQPVSGSTLIFNDNEISTSDEAYIALGTGEAIDFWFEDKNYSKCFSFNEKCKTDENSFKAN
ncbi:hypothetical protein A2164_03395 [Candidatus Curtissbacteria bacterium RBG_13_35_7]|uniref:Glycosyltransferase RgtA/B/C/D-like domain-containing protein n=1 Tax=Candidatus Curtissbacteria bacterium RBG_13_35_7 TaxID=1797705 RepID=A0A1F5G3Y7_9BACT|nr:MAG: hypothetical protein A2164_03395 [Candidatus Curtissbacteria bacterium RBG_13_35_7]